MHAGDAGATVDAATDAENAKTSFRVNIDHLDAQLLLELPILLARVQTFLSASQPLQPMQYAREFVFLFPLPLFPSPQFAVMISISKASKVRVPMIVLIN